MRLRRTGAAIAAVVLGGALLGAIPVKAAAPAFGRISTVVGGSGAGTATNISQQPVSVAVDSAGNRYVVDVAPSGSAISYNVVRKIAPSGLATIVAGTGIAGYTGDGGPANRARLNLSADPPSGLAVDGAGNLYIADTNNHVVRMVDPQGIITTIAGTGSAGSAPTGDGGDPKAATLSLPSGLHVDATGTLTIADAGFHNVRQVYSGFGGNRLILTKMRPNDFPNTTSQPTGVTYNATGDLFVALKAHCSIQRMTSTGTTGTVAGDSSSAGSCNYAEGPGTTARFRAPTSLAIDTGGLYVADRDNCLIRRVTLTSPAETSTYAGETAGAATTPNCGADTDETTSTVKLNRPSGVAFAGSNLLVADRDNWRLRNIAGSTVTTIAGNGRLGFGGDGGPASSAQMSQPYGIVVDAPRGATYVSQRAPFGIDPPHHVVRKIDAAGVISTVAGFAHPPSGTPTTTSTVSKGYSGDGGPATAAQLNQPGGLAVDGPGNLYIADTSNCAVRKVTTAGIISTVAGQGPSNCGFAGEAAPASGSRLNNPTSVAVDSAGNVFIADTSNHVVRVILASNGTIVTVAGSPGNAGFAGDGGPSSAARLSSPRGLLVDGAGDLLIADTSNCRIRKVSRTTGAISTIAGTGVCDSAGDGGPAAEAKLDQPFGLARDGAGNIYVADTSGQVIRVIDTEGVINRIAGTVHAVGAGGDGGDPLLARFSRPTAVAVATDGDVWVVDANNNKVRELAVRKPPAAPTVVTATAGNCTATVSWTPPTDDGGSPISGYTITANPDGVTADAPAEATSATVEGLTNGTSYTFTVAASNEAGPGAPSAASAPVTPVSPTGSTECAGTVSRLFGADRIATAVAVSRSSFPTQHGAGAVVLARSDGYPDALAGAPLAVAKGGPLLLTTPKGLAAPVATELQRVLTPGKTVYLLGGDAALGPVVATAVAELGYQVVRLAGPDRYATAIAIADKGLGNPSTLLVATGHNFPDALAGAAAAAKVTGAVLLTEGPKMAPATKAYLDAHPGTKRYALGGPAATALPTATKLVGVDRWETATVIASTLFDKPTVVGIASGQNFPDALAGGAHIGKKGGPLVLVESEAMPEKTKAYLEAVRESIGNGFLYGGPVAVADTVKTDATTAINPTAAPPPDDTGDTGDTTTDTVTTTTTA